LSEENYDGSTRWCRACGAEDVAGVEVCRECGAALYDSPAPPVDHATVTYDFADWTDGQRRVLELLLTSEGVPFSWDGADLVVPRVAEQKVDGLLEELETFPTDDSPDGDVAAGIDVELTAGTLRRVGTVLQFLGTAGIVVWAIETVSAWQSVGPLGRQQGWAQLSFILGPFSTVLLAGLVIGLGTLCRLAADWTALRLGSGQGSALRTGGGDAGNA